MEAAVEETLAYCAFPEAHWRRIRTNNQLERILREIRRRTRVVVSFPDRQSALKLAAARLRHVAGTAWSTKRYLNIELLSDDRPHSRVGWMSPSIYAAATAVPFNVSIASGDARCQYYGRKRGVRV